jgi:predicted nucleic acid-binding Zn ribbon protein
MSDSTPHKPCRYCAKDIPANALLCSGCNRFQNWRRFFNFTSTILSLLVAFLSVMVVGLPQLLDALKPERAQLVVTFRSNNDDQISLIVYNNGNVAGALEGFAELRVPTDYLPIEDPLISDLFNRLLPYNRIDLELTLAGSENALIEAGASRHFELVALEIKPWHWLFDTTLTVKHELTIVGEPNPGELKETLDEMKYQPETITNVVRELVVTPLEPRVWQDADNQNECTLHSALSTLRVLIRIMSSGSGAGVSQSLSPCCLHEFASIAPIGVVSRASFGLCFPLNINWSRMFNRLTHPK